MGPGRVFSLALAAKLTAVAATAVLARLLTEILPPEEVGRLNLGLASIGLGTLLLIAPVGNLLFARAAAWNEQGMLVANLARYLVLVAVSAAVWSTLPLLTGPYFAGGHPSWQVSLAWWVYALSASSGPALLFLLNILKRQQSYFTLSAVSAAAPLPLVLALSGQGEPVTAEQWLFAACASGGLATGVGLVLLAKWSARVQPDAAARLTLADAVAFSLPLMVANPAFWVVTNVWRYIIEYREGIESLAFVAMPAGIGISLHSAWDALVNDFLKPVFLRAAVGNPGREAWNRYLARLLPLLLFSPAACLCCHDLIGSILLAAEYRAYSSYIFWGSLAYCLVSLCAAFNLLCHIDNQPHRTTAPALIAAVVAVTCALAPFPAGGILVTSLVGGLLAYLAMLGRRLGAGTALREAVARISPTTVLLAVCGGSWMLARNGVNVPPTAVIAGEAVVAAVAAVLALRLLRQAVAEDR